MFYFWVINIFRFEQNICNKNEKTISLRWNLNRSEFMDIPLSPISGSYPYPYLLPLACEWYIKNVLGSFYILNICESLVYFFENSDPGRNIVWLDNQVRTVEQWELGVAMCDLALMRIFHSNLYPISFNMEEAPISHFCRLFLIIIKIWKNVKYQHNIVWKLNEEH